MNSPRKSTSSEGPHRTVVIKVGTSIAHQAGPKLAQPFVQLAGIVGLVRDLRQEGYRVVLVSSGAVGAGVQRLGLPCKPSVLAKKQALAAVGQVHLMRYYEDFFSAYGITCAQVLLTLENLSSRSTYHNAVNTFSELLEYGVIPIVNENDTVAVEQLKIGDNDTLSAQVATLVHADWLFLLTDVDALYTSNPNVDPSAKKIHVVDSLWDLSVNTSTAGTQWGTGGMATKLTAARMATAGGCNMAICHFEDPGNVLDILRGKQVGTVFHASNAPVRGRKRWILSMKAIGELWVDQGAVHAVKDRYCSLFSAGIRKVVGDFSDQDVVSICDEEGRGVCPRSGQLQLRGDRQRQGHAEQKAAAAEVRRLVRAGRDRPPVHHLPADAEEEEGHGHQRARR
jgi:glutamate 5-kinase